MSFTKKQLSFTVVGPIVLVQYIPPHAKDNKTQSFLSLPPPAAVASFLSYVPICMASPESQDLPLASLLVVSLFF